MFIAALNSLQRKFREGQLLLAVEDGRSTLLSPLVKIFQSLEIPYDEFCLQFYHDVIMGLQ